MECFVIYQLMYLVLNELSEDTNEENVINYLSDANPFMRQGETSVDEVVYEEFKTKFLDNEDKEDYCYNFICDYLRNLDPYYGDIYSIFKLLSKEEYIDTCLNIIDNYPEQLKKL